MNLRESGPRAVARVVALGRRVGQRRSVKHLLAALERFNSRLGTQFAGALTYFSFLALVPILMVAFSIAGFVLASRPKLLTGLRNDIADQLPRGLSTTITDILDTAVDARLTVGIIGLVVALYSGISWMGNLRSAIQAMWRPDFDTNQEIAAENLLKYYWKSFKYLVFLGVAILLSLALTAVGSWAQTLVLHWVGLDRVSWLDPVFTVVPIVLAMAADVLIFLWLYLQLAPKYLKPARKPLVRGAMAMSVAFEILKFALTFILPLLLTSATAKLFGPIIGLLFFFNLVATTVLFLAAWIATAPGQRSAAPPNPAAPFPVSPSRPRLIPPIAADEPDSS